jgi:hypothetical protein
MSETSARAIRCARALGSREPKTGAGAAPATVGVGGPDRSCAAPPPGAAPCAGGADGACARGAAWGAGGAGRAAGAGADGAAWAAGGGAGGGVGAGCARCAGPAVCAGGCAGAEAIAVVTAGAVGLGAACAGAACAGAAPLRAPLRVTANVALQRAQRARTPAAGTRAGSTRNTVSQLGQRMFIAPSKPLTHLRWPVSGHRILRHPTGGRPRRQNRAVSWRTSSSRLPVH